MEETIETIYLNWLDVPALHVKSFSVHYANHMGRKASEWMEDERTASKFLQGYKPAPVVPNPLDELQNNVGKLMKLSEQEWPSVPVIPSYEVQVLRSELIDEEWNDELAPAMDENNMVEIADGIVDLLVVVIGMANAYGLRLQPLWNEVQRANESKFIGGLKKSPSGKFLKGPFYSAPNLVPLLQDQGWELVSEEEDV